MSHLRTPEEVFDKIEQDAGRYETQDPREHRRWVKVQIAAAQEQYPFMRDKTSADYIHYHVRKDASEIEAANARPPPSSEEFWNAAYAFDPFDRKSSSEPDALQNILTSGRLGLITLGKVYGHTTLKLLFRIGALPTSAMPDEEPALDFAATDCGAISYPDGHPPGASAPSQCPDPATSSPISNPIPRTRASTDDKLRRFASLGWVMQETSRDTWTKTGHVLVMDMDDRKLRHRQPWFVLASEWPTDGEETQDGDFTFHAQKRVLRNDRGVYVVFPGDHNRTPICAIWPWKRTPEKGEIILKQFGEKFKFEPARFGGHRFAKPSRLGPSLARVMDWYWDPEAE